MQLEPTCVQAVSLIERAAYKSRYDMMTSKVDGALGAVPPPSPPSIQLCKYRNMRFPRCSSKLLKTVHQMRARVLETELHTKMNPIGQRRFRTQMKNPPQASENIDLPDVRKNQVCAYPIGLVNRMMFRPGAEYSRSVLRSKTSCEKIVKTPHFCV